MRAWSAHLYFLRATVSGIGLMLAGPAAAQTLTTLHSFDVLGDGPYTNHDGANPYAGVCAVGNALFGTAANGGPSAAGTVYTVQTDGSGFTVLDAFTGGSDGSNPRGGSLVPSGSTLYGTGYFGGTAGNGVVFAMNNDGSGYTVLHSFSALVTPYPRHNSDGAHPYAGLILSGSTLYGTAYAGGTSNNGTVFKVNTDGTGFAALHSFPGGAGGGNPLGGLVLSGSTLYGTTYLGGSAGYGTVYKVNTDGTGFAVIHSFTALVSSKNNDGATPYAGLVVSGSTLYGTAYGGGSAGNGTVFKLATDGTGFTTLHSFTTKSLFTNADGANPTAPLLLSNAVLYGAASVGGSGGDGTVFQLNTDGTGFTTLHSFSGIDGVQPFGALLLWGGTLYGTTGNGGANASGTVWSLTLP